MKYLFIAILSIMLSGCGNFICKDPVVTDKVIKIDPRYFESCKSLVELPPGAGFPEVLTTTIDNTVIYSECKNKQNDSIILIKRITNNE